MGSVRSYWAFKYAIRSLICASVRMLPKAGIGALPFLMISVACAGVTGGVTMGLLLKMPCRFGGPKGVVSPGCLLWQLTQFCWKTAAPRLALAFIGGVAVSAKPTRLVAMIAPAVTKVHTAHKNPRPLAIFLMPPVNFHLACRAHYQNHKPCPWGQNLRIMQTRGSPWTIAAGNSTLVAE